jgi:hypothetical protein
MPKGIIFWFQIGVRDTQLDLSWDGIEDTEAAQREYSDISEAPPEQVMTDVVAALTASTPAR